MRHNPKDYEAERDKEFTRILLPNEISPPPIHSWLPCTFPDSVFYYFQNWPCYPFYFLQKVYRIIGSGIHFVYRTILNLYTKHIPDPNIECVIRYIFFQKCIPY